MGIDRIEIFVTDLPVRLQRTFSSGSWDTGPSRQLLGKPVLVKLYADGVVGVGQIRPISPGHFIPDTVHSVIAAIREVYGPLMLGREVADIESIGELLDSRLPGNPAARAVLDVALHDALGKALKLPIHKLIGGCCQESIPLEWSVSLADDIGVMKAEARRAIDEFGVRVLCLKAAGKGGWRQDVENFRAVRREVGDDVVIGVDPNTGWTVADTISAVGHLNELSLGYLEQPVERRNIQGMVEIRGALKGVPLMADEGLFSIHDALAHVQARAADVFCIKLYKVGGFTPARKIAAIAEAGGVLLNCGGLAALSQLEAAASAHFCAATPGKRMFGAAEFLFGIGPMGPDPLVEDSGFAAKDGFVSVPKGSGLGITIDEKALAGLALMKEVLTP